MVVYRRNYTVVEGTKVYLFLRLAALSVLFTTEEIKAHEDTSNKNVNSKCNILWMDRYIFFLNETEKQSPGTQRIWTKFLISTCLKEDLETKYSLIQPSIY